MSEKYAELLKQYQNLGASAVMGLLLAVLLIWTLWAQDGLFDAIRQQQTLQTKLHERRVENDIRFIELMEQEAAALEDIRDLLRERLK